jgi:hypothetical protein
MFQEIRVRPWLRATNKVTPMLRAPAHMNFYRLIYHHLFGPGSLQMGNTLVCLRDQNVFDRLFLATAHQSDAPEALKGIGLSNVSSCHVYMNFHPQM